MVPEALTAYAEICGWTLARAHARSGDRIAIAAYLGSSDVFDQALVRFAEAYADRNERDHAALVDGHRRGPAAGDVRRVRAGRSPSDLRRRISGRRGPVHAIG